MQPAISAIQFLFRNRAILGEFSRVIFDSEWVTAVTRRSPWEWAVVTSRDGGESIGLTSRQPTGMGGSFDQHDVIRAVAQ